MMDKIREAAHIKSMPYFHLRAIYIAARYGRKDEALSYAETLERCDYMITSTWIRQVEDEMLYGEGPEAAGNFAQKDYDEIRLADCLVYLSEAEDNVWGRGGRHVEFGYAAGLGKILYVIGPMENLFHYHPQVTHFENFDQFMDFLAEGAQ